MLQCTDQVALAVGFDKHECSSPANQALLSERGRLITSGFRKTESRSMVQLVRSGHDGKHARRKLVHGSAGSLVAGEIGGDLKHRSRLWDDGLGLAGATRTTRRRSAYSPWWFDRSGGAFVLLTGTHRRPRPPLSTSPTWRMATHCSSNRPSSLHQAPLGRRSLCIVSSKHFSRRTDVFRSEHWPARVEET